MTSRVKRLKTQPPEPQKGLTYATSLGLNTKLRLVLKLDIVSLSEMDRISGIELTYRMVSFNAISNIYEYLIILSSQKLLFREIRITRIE